MNDTHTLVKKFPEVEQAAPGQQWSYDVLHNNFYDVRMNIKTLLEN